MPPLTAASKLSVPTRMSVFDDSYANLVGPSDAVYINSKHQACIPDGTPGGLCRKWFGLWKTDDQKKAVCRTYDDHELNWSELTDAIYINSDGKACAPNGTPEGLCRSEFGLCRIVKVP